MAGLDDLSVAELEAALAQKKSYVEDLAARREKLVEELQSLEGEIAALNGAAPKRRGRPPGKKKAAKVAANGKKRTKTGPRPKNKMTMKAAVAKALSSASDGLTLAEAAKAVKKLGYKSKSDNFENVVYQCLYNNPKDFPKGDDKKYRAAG